MLLSTIAEVMIQLHFFLNEIDACPRFTCSNDCLWNRLWILSLLYSGVGGGLKKTNYISYIMVERHLNMYMYNRYVCVIVLSKDNFLNMCVFFCLKLDNKLNIKPWTLSGKIQKKKICLIRMETFSIRFMRVCTSLERMIKDWQRKLIKHIL